MKTLKQLTIVLLLLAVTFGLIPAPIMAQEGAACDADVIVQGDDWLSKIADKFLGDPLAFPAIVEATNTAAAVDESYAQIDNPDIIEIGWKLCIPAAEAAQATLGENAVAAPTDGTVLTVWDIWTRGVDGQTIETLDREFEAAHPGVTINRVVKSFDDMKATAQLALSSDDGPDIAQINQGLSDMVALVQAGLLTDLTPYWQKYNWSERLAAPLAARNSVVGDGSAYGQGNIYGMAPTAEFIGVFYNKEKFANAGVEVPTTFAEFEAALETFKAAGETPIMYGNLDGWPAIHTYGELQNVYNPDQTYLDNFIYGRGDVSFDQPGNVEAAAKLQEWVEKGYFTEDFNGIGYDDIWPLFSNGEGAMYITGTWISANLLEGSSADQIGFFLVPPLEAGAAKPVVAGTSTAYTIRKSSPNQDLAAEYIDWMMSDRAMELWLEAGLVPVAPVESASIEPDTLMADMTQAWDQILATNSMGHYLDWATPTFYDTITASLQELQALRITPEEFVQQLQQDYAAYLAEKQQ